MTTNSFHDRAYAGLLSEINDKDDSVAKLGDTLDVKTSILLILTTFLATETASLLEKHKSGLPHHLQVGAAVVLAAATIAAFFELWPQTYLLPLPESSGIDRIAELREFCERHKNVDPDAMVARFVQDEIGWAKIRISANTKKNETKTFWLMLSFYLTGIAVLLNVATLLYFTHPF